MKRRLLGGSQKNHSKMFAARFVGDWHSASLRYLAVERFRSYVKKNADFLVKQGVSDLPTIETIVSNLEVKGVFDWIALHPQFMRRYPNAKEVEFVTAAASSLDDLLKSTYSDEFRTAMSNIIKSVPTTVSLVGFQTLAQTELRSVTDNSESNIVQMVLAVLSSSMNYLLNTGGSGPDAIKWSTWVIMGDLVGGLLGAEGGPVGAIVVGGVVSALMNEAG